MSARALWPGVALAVLLAISGSACSPTAGSQRLPLPRLPELGSVVLPVGFDGYDRPTAPYASPHPIHVDSAFFELDPSNDLGGNHHCRAQITVSSHDPQVATPTAYTELLGTKLCDAQWFATQWDGGWQQQETSDSQLWTVEFTHRSSGWFGERFSPAVGVVVFEPERGLSVGLWAIEDVYSLEEAVAVAQDVARSVE